MAIQGSDLKNFKTVKIGSYYLGVFTISNQDEKISDANDKLTLGFIGEGLVDEYTEKLKH